MRVYLSKGVNKHMVVNKHELKQEYSGKLLRKFRIIGVDIFIKMNKKINVAIKKDGFE